VQAKLLPASPSAIDELDFGGFFYPTSCQVGSAVVCFKRKEKEKEKEKRKPPPPPLDGTFPSMDENHLISYKLGLGVYYS